MQGKQKQKNSVALFAVLCCTSLWGLAGCESKHHAGDAGADSDAVSEKVPVPADPTAGQETALFAFESGTDEISKNLTDAYKAFVTAPKDEASFKAMFETQKKTKQYFDAHAEDTAQRIIDELTGRDARDERGWSIGLHLLGMFESAKGIQFLFDKAKADLEDNPSPIDSDTDKRAVQNRLRLLAVIELGGIAVRGSEPAKLRILDVVQIGKDLEIKGAAIKAFYAASVSRSKAKEIMKSKLKPEERYLLNEVY
jgi:hypothetical protein